MHSGRVEALVALMVELEKLDSAVYEEKVAEMKALLQMLRARRPAPVPMRIRQK